VAREIEQPLSLLMIDVDNFNDYNKDNGHLAADQALHTIGQSLLNNLRPHDTAIRFEGEKFLVILADTDLATAEQVAEDIRIIAKNTSIYTSDGKPLPSVTVSIGVADQRDDDDPESLVSRAMAACDKAKKKGRNCISTGK
jgi:diguanylate cyclase (GGDEF)-like protein